MAAALKMSTSENAQAGLVGAGTNEEKDQKKKE